MYTQIIIFTQGPPGQPGDRGLPGIPGKDVSVTREEQMNKVTTCLVSRNKREKEKET